MLPGVNTTTTTNTASSSEEEDAARGLDEVTRQLADFLVRIAKVMDKVDTSVDSYDNSSFDETMIDKLIRDIKADAYDEIEQLVERIV